MATELNAPRHVRESAVELRIARLIEPVATDLGYAIVRVRMTKENGLTLQIMAEDINGRFTINDCERLSTEISPLLDVEDPIEREYHLEVSSPGIDRPLVRARDFARYVGHEAKIELSDLVNGRKRFRGPIVAAGDETFTIRLMETPKGEDPDHALPYALLADAKLVMTDALMNMAQSDQAEYPIDDDEEIETVDLSDETVADDDLEVDPADDNDDDDADLPSAAPEETR